MHSEPDEYLRAYNQVVEFLKDPSSPGVRGRMRRPLNYVAAYKPCAATLAEASQGLSVSLVGGISTFSDACAGKPPASCFILRKARAGFPTAFAPIAPPSRHSSDGGVHLETLHSY